VNGSLVDSLSFVHSTRTFNGVFRQDGVGSGVVGNKGSGFAIGGILEVKKEVGTDTVDPFGTDLFVSN